MTASEGLCDPLVLSILAISASPCLGYLTRLSPLGVVLGTRCYCLSFVDEAGPCFKTKS